MQFGLQLSPYVSGPFNMTWDRVVAAAQLADVTAFDSLWVYDHLLYEGGYSAHPYSEPVLESLTVLSAIAVLTQRLKLGPLVLGVPYRNPALVAKMATTLDLISRGRLIVGLGAGWHSREHHAYGYGSLEPFRVRLERLEEAVQILLALWTEQPADFCGKHYQIDNVFENPLPFQRPHPAVLIGGSGSRTLEIAARYGQFCNVAGSPTRVAQCFEVVAEYCKRIGRPISDVVRSVYATVLIAEDLASLRVKRERLQAFIPWEGVIAGTPDDIRSHLDHYARVGCQYMIIRMPDWYDLASIQLFADEIIPHFQDASSNETCH